MLMPVTGAAQHQEERMAETSIQDQIAAVQLETAQIELEEAKFRNAAFKAAQETSRRNRENTASGAADPPPYGGYLPSPRDAAMGSHNSSV